MSDARPSREKTTVKIGVYGDMNLNYIDGSTIWLQSVVKMLHADERNEVSVLLKAKETRELLTAPIRALPRARLYEASAGIASPEWGMSVTEALDRLEGIDLHHRFDVVILRGFALVRTAAERGTFDGRMWPYLTDIPQSFEGMDPGAVHILENIARSSRYLLCQTEEIRAHLESFVPEIAAGKAILLTPMIPDGEALNPPPRTGPFRMVYAGKYAPLWNTLEMTELLSEVRNTYPDAELHMIGDKIHQDRGVPEFHDRMKAALENTAGVVWHGAVPREKVPELLAEADLAMGWRHEKLDTSLELSTKLLEYGQAGLPVLLNRTPMHERLLGADYPLFANDESTALAAVHRVLDRGSDFELARRRTASMVGNYTQSQVYERIRPFLERTVPSRSHKGPQRLKVVAASHDWKFFTRIVQHLESVRGLEVRRDEWDQLRQHDEEKSQALLEWADVILCEWCGGNAIWYSRHKKPHQRLYVRLHRFELYGKYPHEVKIGNVDKVILVGEHYKKLTRERLGWDRLGVISNWVDTQQFDRPKRSGAMFNLGMLGIVPSRKRMDRGVEVLRHLRARDDRYMLFVKTKMPWEYPWHWQSAEEREHYLGVFQAINGSELTRDAVVFDDFGPDVPAWMTKIGYVLSTSDDESFHLAPAEGMAGRSIPMLLNWEGADQIYDKHWIHDSEEAIAEHIHAINEEGAWAQLGTECRTFIERNFSVEKICQAWESLVLDG